MSDEWKQDGLEEFFRDHLGNYEEDPGDALWGQISLNVPPKPGPPWWLALKKLWLPFVILTTATLLTLAYFQYNRIQQLTGQLENQEHQIEHLKTQLTVLTDDEEVSNLTNAQTQSAEEETELLPSAIKVQSAPLSEKIPAKINIESLVPTTTLHETQTSISSVRLPARREAGSLLPLSVPGPAFLDVPATPINWKEQDTLIREKPRFYYALYTEALQAAYQEPIYQHNQWNTFGNYDRMNYGFGIYAGVQWNKHWSIQSGFGWRSYRFAISDAIIQSFDDQDGYEDQDGNLRINYNYPETGPMRLTTFALHQRLNDEEDLQNGDEFAMFINVRYQLNYYNLPLWINYRFGKKKLHFQISGGMNYHFLQGERVEQAQVNFSDSRAQELGTEIRMLGLASSFVELGLAAGIEYDLTEKWYLGLDWTTTKNLSYIYQSERPWLYGLRAQIRYKF